MMAENQYRSDQSVNYLGWIIPSIWISSAPSIAMMRICKLYPRSINDEDLNFRSLRYVWRMILASAVKAIPESLGTQR